MSGTLPEFDLCGPLPEGVTLLEASAGTGKTHAISTLTLRYVTEGVPLERLLVVTFTRMATGELRQRVRDRLLEADAALERVLAGGPAPADDVLRMLAHGDRHGVARRRALVRTALADFDAATIATTHGFCRQVLDGLGVAGDVDRDARFVEEVDDLLREVVDDLYLRRFHRLDDPYLKPAVALEVGRAAVQSPGAPVEPAVASAESLPAMRMRLAYAVRTEIEARKRRLGLLTYDDLLTRLHGVITGPGGQACRTLLAERYDVALVDEFQDTDPVQWDIVREAFGGGTLVLIGDPKQAIYAFRGADVHTYLRATGAAATRATLAVNWRSDQGLIDALDALLDGAELGLEGIRHRPVRAAPGHAGPGLAGAPVCAPMRIRLVRRDCGEVELTRTTGDVTKPSAVAFIARDLAQQVVDLLSSGARVGPDGRQEVVRAGHIGVLVPTNQQAADVRDALAAAGVPAVISGAGSVFDTRAAREWRRLLEAIERPADQRRAASAALTAFVDWTPERLATCTEAEHDALGARLHGWRTVLARHGVAALFEAVSRDGGLAARVLARQDGERMLTDLRHIAHLLHEQATGRQLGVSALVAWLAERIAEARRDIGEDRSRRLESDSEAVQVLTIHRSKGLEFPIVFLPYMWEPLKVPKADRDVPVFHDPGRDGARVIDVGGPKGPGFARRFGLFRQEMRGEDLRLAYVALTRARHQVVLWWAGSFQSRQSPLSRLVVDRAPGGAIPLQNDAVPGDDAVRALLDALAARAPGRISVEEAGIPAGTRLAPPARRDVELSGATLGRGVDHDWGRHSYSGITGDAHPQGVASEPEDAGRVDEPAAAGPGAAGTALPMAGLPAGTAFGSLVHAVLERADLASPDLDAELAEHVAAQLARAGGDARDAPALARGLAAAARTPLGPGLGGMRLCDLTREDRLDELGFELPLAGGDAPTGRLAVDDLATLLDRHLPAGDPLAGYPARLRAAGLDRALRGHMTGAIDLVVRLRTPGAPDRYAVVDHKTNRLGGAGGPTLADYHPAALAVEMQRAHYVLQALIYLVALHRYLRWRVAGYDPAAHLGGAHYLFLRGLAGPSTPGAAGPPHGVLSWTPPAALVVAASDLFDRGTGSP